MNSVRKYLLVLFTMVSGGVSTIFLTLPFWSEWQETATRDQTYFGGFFTASLMWILWIILIYAWYKAE